MFAILSAHSLCSARRQKAGKGGRLGGGGKPSMARALDGMIEGTLLKPGGAEGVGFEAWRERDIRKGRNDEDGA